MSTLTKICVVVLVVLLLFACPIFIQQAATRQNWRELYEGEQARRKLADIQARNQMQAAQVWKRYYDDARSKADAEAGRLIAVVESKNVEISRLATQLAGQAARVTELSALLQFSGKNVEAQIDLNKTLSGKLDARRAETIQLNDQIRQAQQSIKEDQAKIERLNKSLRVLTEQIAQKDAEITGLRARLEVGGAEISEAKVTPGLPKIEATITAVEGDVASLNIGSASGVKEGMKFIVYRGDEFIAHLRVDDVQASSSAGIILDARQAVRVNDKAATRL